MHYPFHPLVFKWWLYATPALKKAEFDLSISQYSYQDFPQRLNLAILRCSHHLIAHLKCLLHSKCLFLFHKDIHHNLANLYNTYLHLLLYSILCSPYPQRVFDHWCAGSFRQHLYQLRHHRIPNLSSQGLFRPHQVELSFCQYVKISYQLFLIDQVMTFFLFFYS